MIISILQVNPCRFMRAGTGMRPPDFGLYQGPQLILWSSGFSISYIAAIIGAVNISASHATRLATVPAARPTLNHSMKKIRVR